MFRGSVLQLMRGTGEDMRVRCADDQDNNLVETALRESNEELQIPPGNVEILGALPSEYSLGNKSRVWPVVVSPAPLPHMSS